jgi:hypothetical protein
LEKEIRLRRYFQLEFMKKIMNLDKTFIKMIYRVFSGRKTSEKSGTSVFAV